VRRPGASRSDREPAGGAAQPAAGLDDLSALSFDDRLRVDLAGKGEEGLAKTTVQAGAASFFGDGVLEQMMSGKPQTQAQTQAERVHKRFPELDPKNRQEEQQAGEQLGLSRER
jgi:hypothetical protein